jgi:predicted ATPase
MKSLGVKNFRNLVNTNNIEIKPITFLLGGNSCGKSTFLRIFPLLRQSVEARTVGPLLWEGRFVDFGSFEECITRDVTDDFIEFNFDLSIDSEFLAQSRRYRYPPLPLFFDEPDIFEVKLRTRIVSDKKKDATATKQCTIDFLNHSITGDFSIEGDFVNFSVNGTDLTDSVKALRADFSSGLVPDFHVVDDDISSIYISPSVARVGGGGAITISRHINKCIHKHVWHKTGEPEIDAISKSLAIGSYDEMLESIKISRPHQKKWTEKVNEWNTNNEDFIELANLNLAKVFFTILTFSGIYLNYLAKNVYYIAPLRATAERYYRRRNLAVDEVDFRGENLALYIRNLTDTERKNFTTWMEENFGFTPIVRTQGGHILLKIREKGSNIEVNLADTGFGFSQILPILVQLWVLSNRRSGNSPFIPFKVPTIFCIEQPELHLHPGMQAQLADILLSASQAAKKSGLDLRLIIETHSETIINRIGHRIGNNQSQSNDINIAIFERKRQSAHAVTIREAYYDNEGYLNNWPIGFFEPKMV